MYDAIDARKREVANQMFNGAQEDDQVDAQDSNETEQEEHSEESDENAQETN
jgi:hypothetical protein